jgi:hypothetical protein
MPSQKVRVFICVICVICGQVLVPIRQLVVLVNWATYHMAASSIQHPASASGIWHLVSGINLKAR